MKNNKLWTTYLILFSLLSGNAFGAEVLNLPNPAQNAQDIELHEIVFHSGNGPDAPRLPSKHFQKNSRKIVTKKAVAWIVSAALVGGALMTAIYPMFNWNRGPRGNPTDDNDNNNGTTNNPIEPNDWANTPLPSFQRGMYVSLWTDDISRPDLADSYSKILGNSTKVTMLLDFITKYKIDSLSLYDLAPLLDQPTMPEHLSDLIVAAKARGVVQVHAVGSSKRDWDWVGAYQKTHPGKFDGLQTETEFWNAPEGEETSQFSQFIDLLDYMKRSNIKNRGRSMKISAYLGLLDTVPNMTEAQVAKKIAQYTDRIYQHCYATTPTSAYQDCKTRLTQMLAAKKPNLDLIPIVSVESNTFSAGMESFLGTWLKTGTVDQLEKDITGQFTRDNNGTKVTGFYYYEYMYMRNALENR